MEKVIRAKIRASTASSPRQTRLEALRKADDIQKRFFSTYISSWINEFLAEADRVQPHVFYRAVIAFARDFLELCDGEKTLRAISRELHIRYGPEMKPEDFFDSCVEAVQTLGKNRFLE